MSDKSTLRLLVLGGPDLVDATLSRQDGGGKIDKGVRELIAESFPHVDVDVQHKPGTSLTELRQRLGEDGAPMWKGDEPDVVLLSVADEVIGLPTRGDTVAEAVAGVEDDLVAVVELIKAKIGAHVLIANVSTVDPNDQTVDYRGLDVEPFVLRAHRVDLLLVDVSHNEGISIIDVDRLVAELGAEGNLEGQARYGPRACEMIAAEVVRVLEDYGFFDDRPLLAQVGARAQGG